MKIYNEEINDLLNIEGQKLEIYENLKVTAVLHRVLWMFIPTRSVPGFVRANVCCFLAAWNICGRFEGKIVNSAEQVFELLQQGEGTLMPICFIFTGLEYFNSV
jgi:hypothetical protein